ncbi:UNVERIFIED_CONTAM: hypothetical protein RF648_18965 [Kocuria sp. CPCC 205274]|uniref:50S ribosomal protein L29 n=1 Tax=Herbiconiux daphne TaxID=2970914 RepID=A0ABT2H9X8_9MICO|nr:hypothetical protein [Herbiconiux daphne]MCS5736768.1 hypothetical protein [Herbiconiux daphne]
MELTGSEKELLLEVLDKHIKFVNSNRRNVSQAHMSNLKMRKKLADQEAALLNLKTKVQML